VTAPVTEAPPKTAGRKWWKYLLLLFLFWLIVLGAGAWYMTTDSFQAFVRRHIVAALEKATGGRVELDTYHTIPFRLQVEIRGLTIHGTEPADQIPLAHVDRVVARIRIISLLATEFGFNSIVVEHPVIHLIVHSDGSTNLPEPKVQRASTQAPVEQLFAFSIRHLEIRRGELLCNDQRTPFDFDATNISSSMSYSFLRGRYESSLLLGRVETIYQDFTPLVWMAGVHFNLGKNDVDVSSLKWNSGRSHLDAHGHIRDFRQPVIEANYSGTVDLAELAAITRQRQLRAGYLDLSGSGSWSAAKFSSDGKAAIKNLEWRDDQLTLRDASLSTDFSVNERQLKLTKAQARLLGGAVTGDAEITNWLTPQAPQVRNAKEKKTEEQKGLIRLRLKDISVTAVASALSTRQYPLDRLNLTSVDSDADSAQTRKRDVGFRSPRVALIRRSREVDSLRAAVHAA